MSTQSVSVRAFKKKKIEMGELAKTFLTLQKEGALTKEGKFLEREKNRVLVVLNNMALNKPGKKSFPFDIDQYSTARGNPVFGAYQEISARAAYKKLAEFFKAEGFLAKAVSRKEGTCYYEYLIINGVKNMKKE